MSCETIVTIKLTIIERKHKGDPLYPIGSIENIDRSEWTWTCFDATKEEYEPFSSGCATSRSDAESFVREEWRNQLKTIKTNEH